MAKSHRVYITDEEANYLGIDVNPSGVYRLSIPNHIKILKHRSERDEGEISTKATNKLRKLYGIELKPTTPQEIEINTTTDTNTNNYPGAKPESAQDIFKECSAWTEDGIMDIDEYCSFYGFPREDVHSYKLVSHTGTPYYNIAFKERVDGDDIDLDSVREVLERDFKKTYTYTPSAYSRDREAVLKWSDLHFGAHIRNLTITPDYDSNVLLRSLFRSVTETNDFKFKKVHVHINGDLIESFSGLNHVNSWMSLNKDEVGSNAVKLCVKLLDSALSEIKNLGKISIVAGNHDRTSKANDEDVKGQAADLIAWGLSLLGYDVEFDPIVTTQLVDGINHVNLHGDKGISKKSTEQILWDYGAKGYFNLICEGHLHTIIQKLSVKQQEKFNVIKDDSIDHRRMHLPSFFTGNYYSESLGYYTNAGYVIVWNNGEGKPQVFFGSI